MTCFWCHDFTTSFVTSRRTLWIDDELFDFMTNFLTSWRTLWYHDELFDITTNSLTSRITFWLQDELFDFMTNVLTSWRTFTSSRTFLRDVRLFDFTTWRPFLIKDLFLTWLLALWRIFDFMTNYLTSWRTFWSHDAFFLLYDKFLVLWQTFWRHD